MSNKGFGKPILHTATYGGKQYTMTATQWMHVLNTTQSSIHRGLLKHYSMQALIDEEYSQLSNMQIIWRRFCFSHHGIKHAG